MYPQKDRDEDKIGILKAMHKRDVIDKFIDDRRRAIEK